MKNNIKNAFDLGAKNYDNYSQVQKKISKKILYILNEYNKLVNFNKKEINVLDLGCGTGDFSVQILNNFKIKYIEVVDLSNKMIKLAKTKIKFSNFKSSVSDFDEYSDFKKFDLIISNMALHWSENIYLLIDKIIKKIKCGCIFLFSVPNSLCFNSFQKIFKDNDNKFIINEFPDFKIIEKIIDKQLLKFKIENFLEKKEFKDPLCFFRELKLLGANSKINKKKHSIFFLRNLINKPVIVDYNVSIFLIVKR